MNFNHNKFQIKKTKKINLLQQMKKKVLLLMIRLKHLRKTQRKTKVPHLKILKKMKVLLLKTNKITKQSLLHLKKMNKKAKVNLHQRLKMNQKTRVLLLHRPKMILNRSSILYLVKPMKTAELMVEMA